MNPYLIGVLISSVIICTLVAVAVHVVFRRLNRSVPHPGHPSQVGRCKKCFGTGDCSICQGTFLATGPVGTGTACPFCFAGACPSCGGTGIDLEAEAA